MSGRHASRHLSGRQVMAGVLLALSVLTAALTVLDVPTPGRLYLTVAFVVLAPGWALTAYLRVDTPAMVWSVSVSLGVSVAIILAQTMVSARFWHPWAAMVLLELLTIGLLSHHLLRWRQSAHKQPAGVTG